MSNNISIIAFMLRLFIYAISIYAIRELELHIFRGVAIAMGGEPPRAPGWGGANEANN